MTIRKEEIPARMTWVVECDRPGCRHGLHTVTETGLVSILRGLHWWVSTETPPHCYCPECTAALQSTFQLGPNPE